MNIPYLFPAILEDNFVQHVEFPGFFSPPECDALVMLGTASIRQKATISENRLLDPNLRKSKTNWMDVQPHIQWMWNKLAEKVQSINKQHYNFRLAGFSELAQFTEYDEEGSHYTWHIDYGAGLCSRRKISITIQLTDPSEYEGGNLELFYGSAPTIISREKGNTVFFPSYTLHHVTPITRGIRHSLVIWVSGYESYR